MRRAHIFHFDVTERRRATDDSGAQQTDSAPFRRIANFRPRHRNGKLVQLVQMEHMATTIEAQIAAAAQTHCYSRLPCPLSTMSINFVLTSSSGAFRHSFHFHTFSHISTLFFSLCLRFIIVSLGMSLTARKLCKSLNIPQMEPF